MRGMLPQLDSAAARLAGPFLQGGANVLVLGSGPHLPLARYGAAKFLEFAIPAQAQCLEEANHLDCFVADAATRVIFLAADAASLARTEELLGPWAELGVASLVLSSRAPSSTTTHMPLSVDDMLAGVLAEMPFTAMPGCPRCRRPGPRPRPMARGKAHRAGAIGQRAHDPGFEALEWLGWAVEALSTADDPCSRPADLSRLT